MGFPHFKEINPPDDIVSKLETNVAEVFDFLEGNQLIDGILLEGVVLSAAIANLVPHKLQRIPRGYFVVKKRPSPVIATSITDIGTERIWPFATAPFGWFIEDGSAISRTTYKDLFAIYGTTFGAGDGTTTFNIPDTRGRGPVGKAASGTGSTLNGTFGSKDFTVSIPAHFHGMGTGADLNITASGAHTHEVRRDGNSSLNTGGGALWGLVAGGTAYSTTESNTHIHNAASFAGRIGLVTGGVDGNASQVSGTANAPSFVRNWIVKASNAAAFGGIDVWDADPAANLAPLFLQLYSTIDATVSLWVF